MKFLKYFWLFCATAVFSLSAFTNRNCPFICQTATKTPKTADINPTVFLTTASPEYNKDDEQSNHYKEFSGSILDLKDLERAVNDYREHKGLTKKVFLDPNLPHVRRYLTYNEIDTFVDTRVRGLNINFTKQIPFPFMSYVNDSKNMKKFSGFLENISFLGGFSAPFVSVSRTCLYQPNASFRQSYKTNEEELENVTKIERIFNNLNNESGLKTAHWSKTGLGNASLYAGFAFNKQESLLLKDINAGILFIAEFPTGEKRDNDNALSFDFGTPTTSLGVDLFANLQLRYGVSAGVNFKAMFPWDYISEKRITVAGEPNEFSPYKETFKTSPGVITAFSPYVQWTFYRDITFDVKLGFTAIGQGKERVDFAGQGKGLDWGSTGKYTPSYMAARNTNGASWSAKYTNLAFRFGTNVEVLPWLAKPELSVFYDHPWHREETSPHHRFGLSFKFEV